MRRPPRRELETSARGADYVLIGPDAFSSAAEPLIELRRSQNLRSSFVSIEQIRDEFGFGEPRPEAIRDFLIHAYHEWPAPALRYVVLLGDGTYDYKDFLGTGVRNHVPPLMIQTSYLWTASDPTLAMVNGDDRLPDIAIGRLPAGSVEQLRALIDKILAFENGAASLYSDPFVLVAYDSDKAGDFVANAEEIGRLVPPPQRVDKLYLSELGRASTRDGILRSFDEGASVMSYIGHGGIHLWADERIFSLDDIDLLGSQEQQPLFLTMNYLNGYFHFPYFDSLSEALVKADGKGAIAAFSPSGLSLDAPAHRYHQALVTALFDGNYERLGDAVLAGQREYAASGAFPELLAIYHILGDPALRLK